MSRSRGKHLYWIFMNIYGRLLGRRSLVPFHQGLLLVALHGLGYDNGWKSSYTGEEWFIKHVLGPSRPRVCLDVGANVGDYSASLLRETGGRVYAFEPARSSFAELQKLKEKYPERLFPINTAVSDSVGEAKLYSMSEKSPTASLDPAHMRESRSETVAVTTLDAFVAEQLLSNIDFIKIDVEGFEREVFVGMQKLLQTHTPKFIQFEFNLMQLGRGYTVLTLANMLDGYDLYRLLPRGWTKINPTTFSNNIFMFCNIIAVRYT